MLFTPTGKEPEGTTTGKPLLIKCAFRNACAAEASPELDTANETFDHGRPPPPSELERSSRRASQPPRMAGARINTVGVTAVDGAVTATELPVAVFHFEQNTVDVTQAALIIRG